MHASQHHDSRRRPAPLEEASSRNGLRNRSDADERLAHRGTCRPIRRCARQVIPRGRALLLPALLVLLLAGRRGPGHLDASALVLTKTACFPELPLIVSERSKRSIGEAESCT